MGARKNGSRKKSLSGRAVAAVAQSLFTRKDTLLNRPVKAVARFCVGQFHKYTGYMKDDMIDSDIGFTAEELNRYQYGSGEPDAAPSGADRTD
jgi:hypothetical protein